LYTAEKFKFEALVRGALQPYKTYKQTSSSSDYCTHFTWSTVADDEDLLYDVPTNGITMQPRIQGLRITMYLTITVDDKTWMLNLRGLLISKIIQN
jgi:hypothetical protein